MSEVVESIKNSFTDDVEVNKTICQEVVNYIESSATECDYLHKLYLDYKQFLIKKEDEHKGAEEFKSGSRSAMDVMETVFIDRKDHLSSNLKEVQKLLLSL